MGKGLTAAFCATIKEPGKYVDAGGLMLSVSPTGSKRWVQRLMVQKKRRDLALGGYPALGLAEAREIAAENQKIARAGGDPAAARAEDARKAEAERRRLEAVPSFQEATERMLVAQLSRLSNRKHRQQWANTLRDYAFPVLGHKKVSEIGVNDVAAALSPIWAEKHETASRLRGRIERVLAFSIVHGWRDEPNPARWKNNLDLLLSAPAEATQVQHRPAVKIEEMPEWFAALQQREGFSARALELAALAWARSGEVRGATWREIDLERRLWVIPAERMKMRKEHRVPLSDAAIGLLRGLPQIEGTDLVFPGARGGALSDMSLSAVMRRMNAAKVEVDLAAGVPEVDCGWLDQISRRPAVPHGLRSTARDWAGRSCYPRDLAERALAHSVGSAVEAAYARDTLVEQRRPMMDAWAAFLTSSTTAAASGLRAIR
ncbi:MAG: integrase [Pelagibaca sp.]|nr:integrase [Pelagibaca sp.]